MDYHETTDEDANEDEDEDETIDDYETMDEHETMGKAIGDFVGYLIKYYVTGFALIALGILVFCAILSYALGLQWAEMDHRFVVVIFAIGLVFSLFAAFGWYPILPLSRRSDIIMLILGAGACILSIVYMKAVGWLWQLIGAGVLAMIVSALATRAVLRRSPTGRLG
jgi:hypothetical protein